MQVLGQLGDLRALVRQWRRDDLRIGFVPTMGNLHAGHYSLVELASRHADRVIASVFVNPTQFGAGEDLARYPRTPEADAEGLQQAGCHALWLPSVEAMYPYGVDKAVSVRVPGVSDVLEGAHRAGHFDGVATVVARLFNQVQPDVAVFGRKDYQQLAVIRFLVEDLAFPVELVAAPTMRASDGLALSSRNQYLSKEERATAPLLHATLQTMRESLAAGESRAGVEAEAARALAEAGFETDYVVVRRPDLSEPDRGEGGALVALVAARLGRTRLIDNIEFEL